MLLKEKWKSTLTPVNQWEALVLDPQILLCLASLTVDSMTTPSLETLNL